MILAAFFLTVAVLPASVLIDSVARSVSASEDLFADRIDIVSLEPVFKPISGMTGNGILETAELFPAMMADLSRFPPVAVDAAELAAALARVAGRVSPSVLVRMAALPTNGAGWLVVFSPWICTLLIWHMRKPLRCRVRRRRR
jgi:hypothetical protein